MAASFAYLGMARSSKILERISILYGLPSSVSIAFLILEGL